MRPNRMQCTRYAFIGLLALSLVPVGAGVAQAMHDFADVLDGDFFHDDVSVIVTSNPPITAGCSPIGVLPRLYCPNNPVTRGQMATFLDAALQVGENELEPLRDRLDTLEQQEPPQGSETLRSGETLNGGYALGSDTASGSATTYVNFRIPLAARPAAPNANFIPAGGASTANCPGTAANPQASPGNLCVYESFSSNVVGRQVVALGNASPNQSDPFGARLDIFVGPASGGFSEGTWAVTAP